MTPFVESAKEGNSRMPHTKAAGRKEDGIYTANYSNYAK